MQPIPTDSSGPAPQDGTNPSALDFVMRSNTSEPRPTDDHQKPPVLEVAGMWSDTVVDVRHVEPGGRSVTGGSDTALRWQFLGTPIARVPRAFARVAWMLAPMLSETDEACTSDLFIPSGYLPEDQFELFRWDGSQFVCRFSRTWDGFTDVRGVRQSFAELIASGQACSEGDGIFSVPIDDDTRVVAELGSMMLFGQMVPDSKRVHAPITAQVDPVFAGVTSTFAAVFALLLMVLWTTPVPAGASVVTVDERVAQLVLQTPPELEQPAPKAPGPKNDPGAKAKKKAGRIGEKTAKMKRARGERQRFQKRQLDQQVVAEAGVLGVLSDNSALAAAFGQSALSADLTGGVGGVLGGKGVQAGSGGFSSRGGGLGGGGTADHFGGADTKGRGGGTRGFGENGGQFTRKEQGGLSRISGDPIILGSLDKSLIDEVIRRNMNQIRYCYQRQLSQNPGLSGKIAVKFIIDQTGQVSSARIKSSSLGNSAVESCITGRFLRFSFPKPKGNGTVLVSYPFFFSPG